MAKRVKIKWGQGIIVSEFRAGDRFRGLTVGVHEGVPHGSFSGPGVEF